MRTVYAARFFKSGGSQCVALPRAVCEALGLRPKDLVVMRLYGSYLVLRRFAPEEVITVDQIPTEALPPAAPRS